MVHTTTHRLSTRGQGDAHDVTDLVARATAGSGVQQGIATVFVVGSTAGMTTIEFEAGAIGDVGAVL